MNGFDEIKEILSNDQILILIREIHSKVYNYIDIFNGIYVDLCNLY